MSFYRIQHRRGPAAEWSASNPVLAGGEFGVETDTGKFKVGNGATAWSGLPYYQDANGIIATITDNAPATLNTLNEIAEALNDNPDILDTLVTKNNATFTGTADFSNATVTGIDLLPSQTNQSGKYLATNGSTTSWATIDLSSKQDVVSGVTSTQISYLGGAVPVTSSIQNQLNQKAALSHAHSISDVTGLQTELDSKLESADLSGYATQSYVNSAISGISLTGYATESYVDTAVSNLVDSAPSTLNTLNELAAALNDDASFATTVTNSIATKANSLNPSFTSQYFTDFGIFTIYSSLSYSSSLVDVNLQAEAPTFISRNSNALTPVFIAASPLPNYEFKVYFFAPSNTLKLYPSEGIGGTFPSAIQTWFTATSGGFVDSNMVFTAVTNIAYVSAANIGYLDGVSSNIQAQLDSKAQSTHTHALSDISGISAAVTTTQINYLDGTTSKIQDQLNTKASTGKAIAMAIVFGG